MKEKKEAETAEDPMAKRVREHLFLHGLNHEQLTLLADCALPAHFQAGEIIFRERETADRFYLITGGRVVLESGAEYGEPVVIETIEPGDVLGWSWMLPPYRWHFTARAVEPTEAIFFAGPILRQYCDRDQLLGFELHKRISAVMMKRLQAARTKMLAIHAHGEKLPPVTGRSPFMEQELDVYESEPNGARSD
jgi:CRP/FNR family transcriptional regulator, cyclic AMP receptor protein